MLTFTITDDQLKKAYDWHIKLQKQMISEGKAKSEADASIGSPDLVYYGAIGGGLTYYFSPTGLGDILRVKEAISGEELDLTDYSEW